MARTRIEMPDHFSATFHIPVRIADINYGNHVGNDAFVALLHEARVQWLKQYGYTELSLEGIGLIMSDLTLEFKNEAFYGDVVEISIAVGDISRVGFHIFYQLQTARNTESVVLALAKTRMVCYDYSLRKVAAIPGALMTVLTI